MQTEPAPNRSYSPPQLRSLKFEQAALFLVGLAWNGDPAARDLLTLIFPLAGQKPPE